MSESLRYLIAIAGSEVPGLVEFVRRVAGAGAAVEIVLLHVVDTEARAFAGQNPPLRRPLWPGPPPHVTEDRLEEADEAGSSALLASWREQFEAAIPRATLSTQIRHGRPEQEIVAAAGQIPVGVIVVCARAQAGPSEPGPRSVGHVARFVADHAPVPVLLVRGGF